MLEVEILVRTYCRPPGPSGGSPELVCLCKVEPRVQTLWVGWVLGTNIKGNGDVLEEPYFSNLNEQAVLENVIILVRIPPETDSKPGI